MARITTVEFPVFSDIIVHVELTNDFDKTLSKYPCIEHMTGNNEDCEAMTVYGHSGCVIFMFLKPNVSVGTIAHESWHAIRAMFESIGVEIENETVAYHLGYLVNKVFRFVRGKK
jgi:hypothetical protein